MASPIAHALGECQCLAVVRFDNLLKFMLLNLDAYARQPKCAMVWLIFVAAVLAVPLARAVSLQDQRVKVSAQWDGKRLLVHKLKHRSGERKPNQGRISGFSVALDPAKRRMQIGPAVIEWDDKTEFSDMQESDLADNKSLTVAVKKRSDGVFRARYIEPGPSDIDVDVVEIIAIVTNLQERPDGSAKVDLLGFPSEIPWRMTASLLQLTRRQDDRRPQDQLTVDIMGRPLVIGGEVGVNPRYEEDSELDPRENDDRARLSLEAQLELFYAFNPRFAVFAEGQASWEANLYRERGSSRTSERSLERGQMWLFWSEIGGSDFNLQVGRQNFKEPREWWWDEDLDALRVIFSRPFYHVEVGVAQLIGEESTLDNGIDPEEEDLLRVIARGTWTWSKKQELSAFFLRAKDNSKGGRPGDLLREVRLDESDEELVWAGLRLNGKFDFDTGGDFEYWLDTAWVGGRERFFEFDDDDVTGLQLIESVERRKLEGWAADIGLIWETGWRGEPTFTLGYAVGSEEFRQTGLHNNNGRFRGVDRFRYYGEFLRPELANLHVWTASAGVPIMQNSSIELVYHYYQQYRAADFQRDVQIDADPSGRSRSLGHELDFVLGLEEWRSLEIEFVASVFRSEAGYGELSGRTAFGANLKIDYNF